MPYVIWCSSRLSRNTLFPCFDTHLISSIPRQSPNCRIIKPINQTLAVILEYTLYINVGWLSICLPSVKVLTSVASVKKWRQNHLTTLEFGKNIENFGFSGAALFHIHSMPSSSPGMSSLSGDFVFLLFLGLIFDYTSTYKIIQLGARSGVPSRAIWVSSEHTVRRWLESREWSLQRKARVRAFYLNLPVYPAKCLDPAGYAKKKSLSPLADNLVIPAADKCVHMCKVMI